MGRMLVGVLIMATVVSASLYDKVGSRVAAPLAASAAPGGLAIAAAPAATVSAPAAPLVTTAMPATPTATVVLASAQAAPAAAPNALPVAVRVAKAPPAIRTSWIVPTAASPATGSTLPVNFPPPGNE